jgi:hypothetical protein
VVSSSIRADGVVRCVAVVSPRGYAGFAELTFCGGWVRRDQDSLLASGTTEDVGASWVAEQVRSLRTFKGLPATLGGET